MQLLILCCRCRAYHEEWCKGLVLKHLRGDAMCGRQGWKRKRAGLDVVLDTPPWTYLGILQVYNLLHSHRIALELPRRVPIHLHSVCV